MDDIAVTPKRAIDDAESRRRRLALRQADAANRIEGQYRTPRGDEVFDAFIRGDIELDEIVPRLKALHGHR